MFYELQGQKHFSVFERHLGVYALVGSLAGLLIATALALPRTATPSTPGP